MVKHKRGDMRPGWKSGYLSSSCTHNRLEKGETDFRKANQERVTVIDSGADESMNNRGKDRGGDRASDCSESPQVKIRGTSKTSNVF